VDMLSTVRLHARWGRGVRAIGQSGIILYHFGRKMALSQTCSNPAAFQDLSYTCMMVWCCKVGYRRGGPGRRACPVGDPVPTRCGCRHRCDISATPAYFQVGPSL